MGADIHGVVEVHLDGEWRMVINIGDISPRHYDIFAQFFGVRGESPYSYKRRGFPENVSWYTRDTFCPTCSGFGNEEAPESELREKFFSQPANVGKKYCMSCCDWHSTSYMTWKEIEQNWDEIMELCQNYRKHYIDTRWSFLFESIFFWQKYAEQEEARMDGEDNSRVRLIVWFDN